MSDATTLQNELHNAIKEILIQKGSPLTDFTWNEDLQLVNDLGFSSLDLAQLIAILEETLQVDPFTEGIAIAEMRTLGDLYKAYAT